MTNNPPSNVPTQTEVKSYLDAVYGKQANVYFNVLAVSNIVVHYDFNTNGALDLLIVGLSPEAVAITNAASFGTAPNAINIYFVNTNGILGVAGTPNGATYASTRATFIQDFHSNSNVNICAHEIGHQMGLSKEVGPDAGQLPGDDDRLMWRGSLFSNPCRLIRGEWTNVNQRAASP